MACIKKMTETDFVNLSLIVYIEKENYVYQGERWQRITMRSDNRVMSFDSIKLAYSDGEDFDIFFDNLISDWVNCTQGK